MAGRYGSITVSGCALTAATAKTVLQLRAVNVAFKLKEVHIGALGVLNTDSPILVEIVRQSTAGTMTNNAPVKGDDSCADSLNMTGQHTATAGNEPTTGDILRKYAVHPQQPNTWMYGDEIICGPADYIGLRVTAPQAVSVDATMVAEE